MKYDRNYWKTVSDIDIMSDDKLNINYWFIKAFQDGHTVEYKFIDGWKEIFVPAFDQPRCKYRIIVGSVQRNKSPKVTKRFMD